MGTIRLTPRDKYASPLGPGRSDHFDVSPRPRTIITGPDTDNQDGSYSIPVQWEPATGDPGLIIMQLGVIRLSHRRRFLGGAGIHG